MDDSEHLYVLDFLLSIAWIEGLTGLSARWIQPCQQQGRRFPALSSLISLLTCACRASSFLTEITQHIHSLRDSGVRLLHIAKTGLSETSALRKSKGIL